MLPGTRLWGWAVGAGLGIAGKIEDGARADAWSVAVCRKTRRPPAGCGLPAGGRWTALRSPHIATAGECGSRTEKPLIDLPPSGTVRLASGRGRQLCRPVHRHGIAAWVIGRISFTSI